MNFFPALLEHTILVVEILAYLMMVIALIKSLYELFVIDRLDMHVFYHSATLTDGVAAALELLMVAEVMKTMIAFDLIEILTLSLLILLRVFLSLVLRHNAREESTPKVPKAGFFRQKWNRAEAAKEEEPEMGEGEGQ